MSNGLQSLDLIKNHFKKVNSDKKDNCVEIALSLVFDLNEDNTREMLEKYKNINKINEPINTEFVWGNYLLENGFNIKECTDRSIIDIMLDRNMYNKKIILRCCEHIAYLNNGVVYDTSLNILSLKPKYYYYK